MEETRQIYETEFQRFEHEARITVNEEEQEQLQQLPLAFAIESLVVFEFDTDEYSVGKVSTVEDDQIQLQVFQTTNGKKWEATDEEVTVSRSAVLVSNVQLTKKKMIQNKSFQRIPTRFTVHRT